MRTVVVSTILVLTALSGCLSEPTGTSVETTTASVTGSTSGTPAATGSGSSTPTPTTTAPAPGPNSPPTANLTSDVANGTVPLNVTFTIDGSDADGDELTWTLDADGDGTEDFNGTGVPTAVTYEFNETGSFTAVLKVTDGEAFAEATVMIAVEEAAAAEPKEDDWAVWDELGQCHAKGAIEIPAAGYYVHERGDPPGTALLLGAGTWVYEESNGVEGLQLGGPDEDDAYKGCVNPDTLIF